MQSPPVPTTSSVMGVPYCNMHVPLLCGVTGSDGSLLFGDCHWQPSTALCQVASAPVRSSLSGVPGSIELSVRVPLLLADTRADMTSAGVAVGWVSMYTATAPVT